MKPNRWILSLLIGGTMFIPASGVLAAGQQQTGHADLSMKTAASSEECGSCHVAIYREYAMGFGGDLTYKGIVYKSAKDKLLTLPANVSGGGTAHSLASLDPFPVHARGVETGGKSCNVCHYPLAFAIPDLENPETAKPQPRPPEQEAGGMTCASCHLTPEGKIRGPYQVAGGPDAPHESVAEPNIRTAAMCAYCHSLGKRVPGKQTQTFLEWREDFSKPGLGRQHCQDCHMPRTLRKTAEDFDVPIRAVARHLWTGGHSPQRLRSALSLVLVQPQKDRSEVELHVINVGAGHSVPTGSNRRGIYLVAEARDAKGKTAASHEWMFAPWYGDRPDDKAFLEEDKGRPDAVSATQADAQGPHESVVRAGEDRVLNWLPALKKGAYTVQAKLIYDLNRYNERTFLADQTEAGTATFLLEVK